MTFSLEGKIALVTGASRGIGREIALRLASAGADVTLMGRSEEALTEVASLVEEMGRQALVHTGDISRSEDAEGVVQATHERFERLDILVNNAGITRDGLLLRMSEGDWDKVLDTNLRGAFLSTKAAAKIMSKQRSGRIVNISSVVGLRGNAGQTNYAASKAGLIGFSKSLAREIAPRGVTVNVVAPGFVETDMTADLPQKVLDGVVAQVPLSRMGSAAEIASAVHYLASDEASYVTGHVLVVDGGMAM